MKGITDLSPIADAPALEELLVFDASQLNPENFKPFIGHPSLKSTNIGIGSMRKNEEIDQMLGRARGDRYEEFTYV